MVLDALEQSSRYHGLHPAFARAFAFLRESDLGAMAVGRHALDTDGMFVLIDRTDGRGREAARLEAHRRHIDIQFTFAGVEEIGWRAVAGCDHAAGPFDESQDLGFFRDRPDTWLVVPQGHFAIFFPDDAHAPLAGTGRVGKAIVKVPCNP